MSEYNRQLRAVIERIRELSEGEALTMDEQLSIRTLKHFIRRPDLARGSAEFAIRRAVPSWWVNAALWWDDGERSIFGSYVERQAVKSIRGEVIRRVYGADGYEIEQLQPPGEFCYACRQWQSKAAFNWHMGRGGECKRESYCQECQQGNVRIPITEPKFVNGIEFRLSYFEKRFRVANDLVRQFRWRKDLAKLTKPKDQHLCE